MMRFSDMAAGLACLTLLAGCTSSSPPSSQAPPAQTSTDSASATRVGDVKLLAVIGDSISIAVNACGEPGACPDSSWVQGTDPAVNSIASRLHAQSGTQPTVINQARDGGDMADAVAGIGAVAAKKPDLVTILVGANDVCAPNASEMTSVDDFRTGLSTVLSELDAGAPDAAALVMSLPDLNQVWSLGKDNPRALALWSDFWGCRNLLRNPNSTDPQVEQSREAVADRAVEFNNVIADVCAAAPNCISDGGALYAHEFTVEQVSSIDFFHPSAAGQQAIAEIAWKALENGTTP